MRCIFSLANNKKLYKPINLVLKENAIFVKSIDSLKEAEIVCGWGAMPLAKLGNI